MTQAVFLYNKSNPYGISQDVKVLEEVCYAVKKELGQKQFVKVRHADPLEPPSLCDIAFHFEIPIYGWYPWARKNVLIVNPEWYEAGWDSYLCHTDFLIFKCQADADRFLSTRSYNGKVIVLPWTTQLKPSMFASNSQSNDHSVGALWLLGASRNKRAAAERIVPLWRTDWPRLHIYTTTPLTVAEQSNVEIHVGDLEASNRKRLQAFYPLHLIFSQAEALGLAAFEGQAAGAYLIGNALPTFQEGLIETPFCSLLPATLEPLNAGVKDTFASLTQDAFDAAMQTYLGTDLAVVRKQQSEAAEDRQQRFQAKAGGALLTIVKAEPRYKIRALPPVLGDFPSISIITLLHNRRRFVDLCFHNLLITDYPKDKIEWVVVEDSDNVDEQASDKVMKFARQQMEAKGISVSYIPLQKVHTIGEKRNMACQRAQHSILLMMDDDDHYPSSSFSRRVAWLMRHPSGPQAAVCTTIACYDLLHGTSAVNTPPWSLGLKERVSEATLTFTKSFWEAKPFPSTNMAEGDGFLEGREEQVLELQPQQIIVAMSHGTNASSRRIPQNPSGTPSCFWGFPKEFLMFLHRLAGVTVETDASSSHASTSAS